MNSVGLRPGPGVSRGTPSQSPGDVALFFLALTPTRSEDRGFLSATPTAVVYLPGPPGRLGPGGTYSPQLFFPSLLPGSEELLPG